MLTIRLSRTGKKGQPSYRLIVSEKHKDPWGRYLELLGNFNPRSKEFNIKKERIEHWLKQGAQMSATVNNLLLKVGIVSGKKQKSVAISKTRKGKMDKVVAEKKAKEEAEAKKKEAAEAAVKPASSADATEAEAEPASSADAKTAEAEAAPVAEETPAPAETPTKEVKVEEPAPAETAPVAEPASRLDGGQASADGEAKAE